MSHRSSLQAAIVTRTASPLSKVLGYGMIYAPLGFLPKVKSSALVPLLLIVAICGAGAHGVGLAGVSLGYFTWSVRCEGVVTVAGDGER